MIALGVCWLSYGMTQQLNFFCNQTDTSFSIYYVHICLEWLKYAITDLLLNILSSVFNTVWVELSHSSYVFFLGKTLMNIILRKHLGVNKN